MPEYRCDEAGCGQPLVHYDLEPWDNPLVSCSWTCDYCGSEYACDLTQDPATLVWAHRPGQAVEYVQ